MVLWLRCRMSSFLGDPYKNITLRCYSVCNLFPKNSVKEKMWTWEGENFFKIKNREEWETYVEICLGTNGSSMSFGRSNWSLWAVHVPILIPPSEVLGKSPVQINASFTFHLLLHAAPGWFDLSLTYNNTVLSILFTPTVAAFGVAVSFCEESDCSWSLGPGTQQLFQQLFLEGINEEVRKSMERYRLFCTELYAFTHWGI